MDAGKMTSADVFVSVVLANLLCGGFVYCLWRLRHDEHDLKAIGGVLVCCLIVGVMAWPA